MVDKCILKIQDTARAHGIANANQLRVAIDVAPMVARRLWNEELTKIDFRILATLCRVFACQPGDLIVYEAGKGSRKASKK